MQSLASGSRSHRVILTVFAGRKRYLDILMKHIHIMLDEGTVDECHLWDFTRDFTDFLYLRAPRSVFDHPRVRIMSVQKKTSWTEYYDHYASNYGDNDGTVVIKCDDDIVFVDTSAVKAFIEYRIAHPEHLFVFPCIVNNGLCAYYMQSERDPPLLPSSNVGPEFELRKGGFETLVDDGTKAKWLHERFLSDPSGMRSDGITVLPFDQRISINFFAVMSRDLHVFATGITDDERYLTQVLPSLVQRHNVVYWPFVVSHFAFGPQRNTGLDDETERVLLSRYDELARRV